jgi:hypothetical protein
MVKTCGLSPKISGFKPKLVDSFVFFMELRLTSRLARFMTADLLLGARQAS